MFSKNCWALVLLLTSILITVTTEPSDGVESMSFSDKLFPNRSCLVNVTNSGALFSLNVTDKRILYPNGLSAGFNLANYINIQTFYYSGTTDTSLCDMNSCDNGEVTPYFVSYPDNPVSFKICICKNSVMDLGYMGFTFSRVPLPVRRTVKSLTAASYNMGGGAVAFGDHTITFFETNMKTEVFVHEAAHCFDEGQKSNSRAWLDAMGIDGCVPDPYALTSPAEDYAQTVVVWVYMVVSNNINNNFFSCISNTIYYVQANGLPASSISRN